MGEHAQKPVMRFGVFEVNLRSGDLCKHGLRVRVPGQAFKILRLLLERPGEVVTREELRNSLWPVETFVDFEHSLNSAVKKLREALGDSADNPRYIETVPRMGYRFIAPLAVAHAVLCASEGFQAVPQLESGSVPDASPSSLAPSVAAVCERGPSEQAPADPKLYARTLAVRSGLRSRRALAIGTLLATVAVAALLSVSRGRTRALPFQMTATTRLTSAGQNLKAAISPDGRYIAHTLVRSGQESLRVRRATTLHDIEIVPPAPVHYLGITFSPDSETVYYVTHTTEAAPTVLYRVPVLGGSPEKLKQGLASPVTFSPDGTRFAFVRESGAESSLIVADLASGGEQRLVSHKLPEVLDYPAWSPDGRIIACSAVDTSVAPPQGSAARIVGVRVRDGTEKNLSGQTWRFIKELAWLGDGSGLVMSARAQRSAILHVWYVSYPEGTGRKLSDGLNQQVGASISADSRQIVTVEESMLAGIWRMRAKQGQEPESVVESTGSCTTVWMPDGRILFEKELNGYQNLWTVDADGTNQKQLTLTGNNYSPSVSSDGRMLACLSDRNGSSAIWTMDIDGGNPVLAVKALGEAGPQLSPDGKWIAFTAPGSGRWNTLWRVGSKGGRAIQLNDNFWLRPAISPDGKWIAGFYADQQLSTNTEPTGIAVIRIDGGQPSKVFPIQFSVLTSAGIRWTPDGLQLAYVDRRNGGDNIWTQPLNGGAPHQVTQLHGDALFNFDWSRDGKQLVFNRGIQARDVVLIKQAEQK